MSWKSVALGDACDVIAGGTPKRSSPEFWAGDIPWVKISDMLQGTITSTEETISRVGLENSAAKMLPSGTLLISIFATIGRTAVLGCDAATNQAIVGVIPKPSSMFDKIFLHRFLDYSIGTLVSQARGVAQANINGSILKALQIPFPPPPEQKQIGAILDTTDTLRLKRRKSIELLDSLISSTFLEMFGDPMTNPKRWREETIQSSRSQSKVGPFGSLLHKSDYITGGVPLINPKHIVQGKIQHGGLETVSEFKAADLSNYRLQVGDVVMGRRGDMGRCTTISPEQKGWLCGTGSVFIRPNQNKVKTVYLNYLLSNESMKQHLESLSGGAIMPSLSGKQIKELVIQTPPLDLQNQFATIVESIEQQKTRVMAHLAELDILFASVQSRAFNGEL